MNRRRARKAAGALFGVMAMVCGFHLYAQQTEADVSGAAKGGTFTIFDVPGAGTGFLEGTFPLGINPAGTITGYYQDADFLGHGFLRSPDGVITTFDPPGSIFTSAISI